ncbi:MAG: hypothetical protein QFB86_04120 [Patescibacteria group bacterium]|nr:hypothetical protein [Patescibacteria group bacterium]
MKQHFESFKHAINLREIGAAVLATAAFAGPGVGTATSEGFKTSATAGVGPDQIQQHTSYSDETHLLKYGGKVESEQPFVPNTCSPTVYMFAAKHKSALTNSREQIVLTPLTQVCAEGDRVLEQPKVQSYDFEAPSVMVTKKMRVHIRSLQKRGYFVIARGQYGNDYQDTTVPLMQVSPRTAKTTASSPQKI